MECLTSGMLSNPKFASQLKQLLAELQTDGHDIEAAWDEYHAMVEALQKAQDFLSSVTELAIKTGISASTKSLSKRSKS